MLRLPRIGVHEGDRETTFGRVLTRTLALVVIAVLLAVAPDFVHACDWDPTGECGGSRWSGWSVAVKVGAIAGASLLVVGGAVLALSMPKGSPSRRTARVAALIGLAGSFVVAQVASEYVNWPHGRPADLPAGAPK